MIIYLLFIIILLCLSAFFSGSETAVFAIDRIEAKEISLKERSPLAAIYRNINHFLTTVLLLNLLANAAINVLGTVITVEHLGGEAYLPLMGFISTAVILTVSEIAPKVAAVRYSMAIARFAACPACIHPPLF